MAATYTREFCEAIVEAYKLHLRAERKKQNRNSKAKSTTTISKRNGSLQDRDQMDNSKLELLDEDVEDLPPIDELMEIFCPNGARLPESNILDKCGSMNSAEQAECGPAARTGEPVLGRSASQ